MKKTHLMVLGTALLALLALPASYAANPEPQSAQERYAVDNGIRDGKSGAGTNLLPPDDGGGTCWGIKLKRSRGLYPYGRRLFLYTVWCGSNGVITYRSSAGPAAAGDPGKVDIVPADCGDRYDNDYDGRVDYPADPGCTSSSDGDEWNPPPAPPPPLPPPPPPPPPPACSDGADNDGDGFNNYPSDPGCSSASDDDEWNDWASLAEVGTFTWGETSYACGTAGADANQWYTPGVLANGIPPGDGLTGTAVDTFCPLSTSRCKKQVWETEMIQKLTPWGPSYRALTFKGFYSVCYRYNDGIVTVKGRAADCYAPQVPWQCNGIAEGYPWHYRAAKYVEFHYRIKACIQGSGCTVGRQPWVTITFFDNNTQNFTQGLA
jgi:hypothetical protein